MSYEIFHTHTCLIVHDMLLSDNKHTDNYLKVHFCNNIVYYIS